jgi:hypothetical protein
MHIVLFEIARMSNAQLERILDRLADSGDCVLISIFDNFIVEG